MFGSLKSLAESAASTVGDAAKQASQAGASSLKGPKCIICATDGAETRAVITCVCCLNARQKHKLRVKEETTASKKGKVLYTWTSNAKITGVLTGAATMISEAT